MMNITPSIVSCIEKKNIDHAVELIDANERMNMIFTTMIGF